MVPAEGPFRQNAPVPFLVRRIQGGAGPVVHFLPGALAAFLPAFFFMFFLSFFWLLLPLPMTVSPSFRPPHGRVSRPFLAASCRLVHNSVEDKHNALAPFLE
jgi:hypothetical protein